MKQTITPERLLGEYIGELNGICAWDIPEQLREKLERRVKELEELQIEMEVQHRFKEKSDKQTEEAIKKWQSGPQKWTIVPDGELPIVDVRLLTTGNEDVFDITTMD